MKRILYALVVCLMGVGVLHAQAQTPTTPAIPNMPFMYYGGTGTFQFSILANGVPYTPPAGYTPKVVWTADDTNVVLTPSADTLTVSAKTSTADKATSFVLTAVCTAPDGTVLTQTITVPLTAVPVVYSAVLAQTGEVGP